MSIYGVLSGLNYYKDPANRLNGCINDMLDYEKLLLEAGVPAANITCLSDSQYSDDPLYRKRKDIYPSKENMIKELDKLHAKVKPGDTVFVTYSGHGTNTRKASSDEPDGQSEAIYTADGQLMTDNEFYGRVANVPKGVKVVVVMDCCHSATILDLKNGIGQIQSNRPDNPNHGYVVMISGCQDNQTSADYLAQREEKQHVDRATGQKRYRGALTAGLVETIKKVGLKQTLDTAFSGSLTLMKIFRDKVLKWLSSNGFDQVPNVAYEGSLPAIKREGVLHAYRQYPLRATKSRIAHVENVEKVDAKRRALVNH